MPCDCCENCPMDDRPLRPAENCPQEVHITVVPFKLRRSSRLLEMTADRLGVTPSVFETIHARSRRRTVEAMVRFNCADEAEARRRMVEVGDELAEAGWDPIRAKIEAAPWTPRAHGARRTASLPAGQYWETHMGIDIYESVIGFGPEILERLRIMMARWDGYVSWRRDRVADKVVLTIRSTFGSRLSHDERVESLGWEACHIVGAEAVLSPRTEYTWMDHIMDRRLVA